MDPVALAKMVADGGLSMALLYVGIRLAGPLMLVANNVAAMSAKLDTLLQVVTKEKER